MVRRKQTVSVEQRERANEGKGKGMERLTKKIDNIYVAKQIRMSNGDLVGNQRCLNKLGELEDLEEQGLLLQLPCKIGDTMWTIRCGRGCTKTAQQGIVSEMFFTNEMRLMIVVKYVARGEFGKTVFHTQEEAEEAIERNSY
jgi:hypothetical protein